MSYSSETKKCPYCAEEIKQEALKCKHCGEILDGNIRMARSPQPQFTQQKVQKWSPGMDKGDVGIGILWFVITIIGYVFFIVPGLILHLICIVTAASGDPYR